MAKMRANPITPTKGAPAPRLAPRGTIKGNQMKQFFGKKPATNPKSGRGKVTKGGAVAG